MPNFSRYIYLSAFLLDAAERDHIVDCEKAASSNASGWIWIFTGFDAPSK